MQNIAVIDVETTGLNPFRYDRIIELAAVVITPDGSVISEFETLINPKRDIGPTQIHGLTTEDVVNAPEFHQVAGSLIETLAGCVALAGHNVRFDLAFLNAEFERCGFSLPEIPTLCTMRLAGGGSLSRCCSDFGIHVVGDAHSAKSDALASAQLLALLLKESNFEEWEALIARTIAWPEIPIKPFCAVTRKTCNQSREKTPNFLQKLLNAPHFQLSLSRKSEAIEDYIHLLSQVLEDGVIDDSESEALVSLALRWGLSTEDIQAAHKDFIIQLAIQAWEDGILTQAEQRDLNRVANLLGVPLIEFQEITDKIRGNTNVQRSECGDSDWFKGKSVCFTGECQCDLNGERITRPRSFQLAEERGLMVAKGVTKSLDILVVADPLTQSSKAKTARKYGTRVMQARVFWRALGLKVS